MPQGWDLGVLGGWGVKNLSVGICDGAPSTVHSSFYLNEEVGISYYVDVCLCINLVPFSFLFE